MSTSFTTGHEVGLIDAAETPFSFLVPSQVVPGPGIHAIRFHRRLTQKLDERLDAITAVLATETTQFSSSDVDELIHRTFFEREERDEDDGLRQRAVAAVARLTSVLSVSEQHVARLTGISRNTIASWRSGERSPYPATVRPLFEIEMLVGSVSERRGTAQAWEWFGGFGVDGMTRLEILLEAIRSGVAIPSSTLEEAGINLPDSSWQALNSFQARFTPTITADEDGNALVPARLSSDPVAELGDDLEFLTD